MLFVNLYAMWNKAFYLYLYLFIYLFINLRVAGLCEGNPPLTGGFPSWRASKAEIVSILWPWRHHESIVSQPWPQTRYQFLQPVLCWAGFGDIWFHSGRPTLMRFHRNGKHTFPLVSVIRNNLDLKLPSTFNSPTYAVLTIAFST